MKIGIFVEFKQQAFDPFDGFGKPFMLAILFQFLLHHFVGQTIISVVTIRQTIHEQQLIEQKLLILDVGHIGLIIFHHLVRDLMGYVFTGFASKTL